MALFSKLKYFFAYLVSPEKTGRNKTYTCIAALLNFTHLGDESSILFLPKMGMGIEVRR